MVASVAAKPGGVELRSVAPFTKMQSAVSRIQVNRISKSSVNFHNISMEEEGKGKKISS